MHLEFESSLRCLDESIKLWFNNKQINVEKGDEMKKVSLSLVSIIILFITIPAQAAGVTYGCESDKRLDTMISADLMFLVQRGSGHDKESMRLSSRKLFIMREQINFDIQNTAVWIVADCPLELKDNGNGVKYSITSPQDVESVRKAVKKVRYLMLKYLADRFNNKDGYLDADEVRKLSSNEGVKYLFYLSQKKSYN